MLGIETIDVQSGSATLRFDTEFLYDTLQEPALYADVTPTTPLHLTASITPAAVASVVVESAAPIEITTNLTAFQWQMRLAEASLLISYGQWHEIQVSLTNQACKSGLSCSGDIQIVMENAALPVGDVGRLALAATQEVSIRDDGIKVHIQPNAVLGMTNVSDPNLELARFDARLTSEAVFETTDGNWQFKAAALDVGIEGYSVYDSVTFSAPVFLDDVSFSQSDGQLFAKIGVYASSSQLDWGDRLIQLPGFTGGIGRQGADIAILLETAGLYEEASIEVSHNLDNDIGQLSLTGSALSFDAQQVSSRISPWAVAWDISAGTLACKLHQ